MGSSKSKLAVLSYEDAEKRMLEKELIRLRQVFGHFATRGTLSLDTFYSEVFGEFVPFSICETIFNAFKISSNSKGINFKELLIGIIILTGGSYEEKCRFIFSLYCNDSGIGIEQSTLQSVRDEVTDEADFRLALAYLDENAVLPIDKFMKWINECPKFNELTYWFLLLGCPQPFVDKTAPLDLYQLVAGISHLDELEIIELEKAYRRLVASFPQKTIDIDVFNRIVSPPLPEALVKKVFLTFDENEDGSIDLKELACGISACTRGPTIERKKFCCKIFDDDKDGRLGSEDIVLIFTVCIEIQTAESSASSNGKIKTDKAESICYHDVLDLILSSSEMTNNKSVSIDDFLIWMNDYDFIDPLLDLLNQICTVIFNVRPQNLFDEEQIISKWLRRAENCKILDNSSFHLISRTWLKNWLGYVRNAKKDICSNPSTNESKGGHRVSYSKSMNNVLNFNKKHQYDLNKTGKFPTRVKSSEEIIGRFTLHTSMNGGCNSVDIIYPDFNSRVEFGNNMGSSNSISSFSSHSSFQDMSQMTKLMPINNQDLLNSKVAPLYTDIVVYTDDGGIVDSNVKWGEDFELLPREIWNCLSTWYGGGPSIPRPVWIEPANLKADENHIIINKNQCSLKVEIHLLTLYIMRHVLPTLSSTRNIVASSNKFDFPALGVSSGAAFIPAGLNNQKALVGSLATPKRQVRGRVSFSRHCTLNTLIELLSEKLKINKEEMRIWKVIEDNNLILLEHDERFLQDLDLQSFDKILVEQRNTDLTWPEELNQLATIRSLQNRKASSFKGVTGLSNIGNTCFFNSAIQCVSNTSILTTYFIRDIHLYELNKTNVQGCNGMVALRYAELIKDIWAGSSNLIVPLKLKMTIDRYVNQFSGNQQHDAQEFLSALLDSLHEDLNRVKEKPSYKELKDSDGRSDEEVADEAWKSHIESNQSIIVDLFHGLLRSNVCCDICRNNSVRFDAYSMLSLPIPMQTSREIDVLVFFRYSPIPRKHCVILLNSIDASQSFIIDQLAKQLSMRSQLILLALIEENKIKKFISSQDKIVIGQTVYAYISECDSDVETSVSNGVTVLKNNSVFIVYHRRMILKEDYFMAHSRTSPEIFSYPVVFSVKGTDMLSTTNRNIYERVLASINGDNGTKCSFSLSQDSKRLSHQISNHAIDCDSVDHAQPFKLSRIHPNGTQCNQCHWSRFCRGCSLPCTEDFYQPSSSTVEFQYLAIDWSTAALHLKFSTENEKMFVYDDDYKDIKSSNNQPMDLLKCIDIFTTEETLEKDTLYQCTKCKNPQPAHKKLDLWTLPPVLIIHLKRFQFLDNKWQKSHKVVRYPIRNLDLSSYIKANSSSPRNENNGVDALGHGGDICSMYNLYAVNCHLGNLQMGHYITYARNKESGHWYMYNDSICKEVDEKDVNTNSAYLLFYERENVDFTEVLDGLAEQKIPELEVTELVNDEVEKDLKRYCTVQ